MFKRKKTYQLPVLSEQYRPATLPGYGVGTENFKPEEYSLHDPDYIERHTGEFTTGLMGVINTTDDMTPGNSFDAYADSYIDDNIVPRFEWEKARNDSQCERISTARDVCRATAEHGLDETLKKKQRVEQELEPLRGVREQFRPRVGRLHIPLALIVTIAAMVVDACVNYAFLETILIQHVALLIITVAIMSVMSDFSMFVLGNLLSRRHERFMHPTAFNITVVALTAMFAVSVIASVMIRVGSMPSTFAEVDINGSYIQKSAFDLAEWGITLVTALLTASTGIISFALSYDDNAHLVSRRRELEKEYAALDTRYSMLVADRTTLERAPDPTVQDALNRAAAEKRLKTLRREFKLIVRKMLAQRQNDAQYTDAMSESADTVVYTDNDKKELM